MRRVLALFCAFLLFFSLAFHAAATEAEKALSHGNRDKKCIALTFDDGPHPRYTPKILELLEKYHIKATFFMIGSNARLYPELAKAVFAAGHEIGSHTYSHPHMLGLSCESLLAEIKSTEDIFLELGLPTPSLFRPPEGYRTKEQCALLSDEGYRVVVWSLDTHDWKSTPSSEIVRYVTNHIEGGDIILFHDYISGQNTTITALEQIIPRLLADGYEFVTVSDMMA